MDENSEKKQRLQIAEHLNALLIEHYSTLPLFSGDRAINKAAIHELVKKTPLDQLSSLTLEDALKAARLARQ